MERWGERDEGGQRGTERDGERERDREGEIETEAEGKKCLILT